MAVRKAEALYDFHPTAPVELKLEKGDVILVRRTSVGEGWWEGELNSMRGLFPSSYVKLLPLESKRPSIESPKSPSRDRSHQLDRPKTPLTPGTSKKAFMESLLAPPALQQDQLYSKEKASELFVRGHSDIGVTAGPSWDCQSPFYSITVRHQQQESSRVSGLKRWSTYIVETAQLACRVTRKFKHFLWVYDKLAELFPCISLPPLPVKQYSGPTDPDGVEARRRGLERFLARVSGHPVLGCTKIFHTFLTAKDDKDWKIGRQNSNIKLPKAAKKLFAAPVYNAIKYPAYNLPLNQLASIEKFSKFSRQLETSVNTLENSYLHVSGTNMDMINSLNLLGMDIQRFTKGQQPTTGAKRRKLMASSNAAPGLPNGGNQPSFHVLSAAQKSFDLDEDESEEGEEWEGGGGEWNWREDARFSKMAQDLHSIAGNLRQVSQLGQEHQETLEKQVLDVLREYSGIIHTLPVLVKLHEEAMEMFDASKEKDSKKEAEVVRKHCDTLNNILLSEFDHFSKNMVQDFEGMIEGFLQEQANFHRQLAEQWDSLHHHYSKRLSSRRRSNAKAHSSGANSTHSLGRAVGKSGSFTASLPSSGHSTPSLPDVSLPGSRLDEREEEASPRFNDSFDEEEPADTTLIPSYISVQRKAAPNQGKPELTESDIIDPEILAPRKKSVPEPPFKPTHLQADALPRSTEAPSAAAAVEAPRKEDPHYDNYKPPQILGTTPPGTPSKVMDSIVFLKSNEYETFKFGSSTPIPKNKDAGDDRRTEGAADAGTMDISVRYDTPHHKVTVSQEMAATPPSSDSASNHEYANLEFGKVGTNLPPVLLAALGKKGGANAKSSSPGGKKPMPIQRKRNQSDPEEKDVATSNSVAAGSSAAVVTDSTKSPAHSKANAVVPKKPLPPAKPLKLQSSSDDVAATTTTTVAHQLLSSPTKEGVATTAVGGASKVSKETQEVAVQVPVIKPRSLSSSLTDLSEGSAEDDPSFPLGPPKPRSYTNVDQRPELKKREPLLPPAPPTSTIPTSSAPSSNLVTVGQFKRTLEPAAAGLDSKSTSNLTDLSGHPQAKNTPPVVAAPASSQHPPRARFTKPLPPSKVKLLASTSSPPAVAITSTPKPLPADKSAQVNAAAKSKAAPPPKPPRAALSRASTAGGNRNEDDPSPKGRDELMRKLSQRRMRIDQQIANTPPADRTASPASSDNSGVSERNSTLSSSSSHSEVVVAYHTKKIDSSNSSIGEMTSPVIAGGSLGVGNIINEEDVDNGTSVNMRDNSLAKFGIIEDVSGGTYVI